VHKQDANPSESKKEYHYLYALVFSELYAINDMKMDALVYIGQTKDLRERYC
jgi:hypothetical protein